MANCCEPCGGKGLCQVRVNCCIQCHMAWEENAARSYFPANVLAQLMREHERLERSGFRHDDLVAHSRWEEKLFQRYCPQEVVDQVLVDHEEYEAGRLLNRDAAV